ncbi:MAG: methionine synthase vitamin-B12 independent [Hyphomicrobiales bacterium]|nr:methionine synthase vitamin-B12 independent [Hyphomicrobiales bacterium]
MPLQKNPPFRAEIVGSYLRPAAIKDARASFRDGAIDAGELRRIEDEEIRKIVAFQEEVGLQVATDGEFRRSTYSENFTTNGLTGVKSEHVGAGDWTYSDGKGGTRAARVPVVMSPIRWAGSTNAKDFAFLKSVATKATPKITLPGPCYIHYRSGRANISRDVYPSLEDFWSDLAAAYHAEMQDLYDAGCRYLQLDETSLAKLGDPKIQHALETRGDNWRDLVETYTDALNAVVAGAPSGMTVAMHLCRGNQAGHWQASGGYDLVAERLFKKVRIGTYLMEFDTPRAGNFEPLRHLPSDKTVVLGLVSTKTPSLEDKDVVRSRLKEAGDIVPLDQLCLSPQCGFASSVPGNPLTFDDQRAKLKLVVDLAKETWG